MKSGECFLLVGKERLLKKEFILELKKKSFADPSNASMNTQEWDIAENPSPASFFDFIRTAPFLGEKRIAVLWQVEKFDEESREGLAASLENLPSTTVIVFATEEVSTKKSAFLRKLEAHCTLVACHAPFDRDLPGWVETRAKRIGATLDREATRVLIERTGKDGASLQHALEQLSLFIHPRTSINAQDVEKLLGKTREEDIFAVADDLLGKNIKGAIEKLECLFREGVRAPEVIGVLAGQLERMKQACDFLERGASLQETAAALRVHSFFQQKFFTQLKKLSKNGIARAQKRLLECDLSIKEGRLAERAALEKFILEG